MPRSAVRCRRYRRRGDSCARRPPAWAARTAVARGDVVRELALLLRERREEVGDRRRGDGKPEELAPGDGRRRRDGALRRGRGSPFVRPHDDREHGEQNRPHDAAAARRRRADHELQHAASERRLEGVPGDFLREYRHREALGAGAPDAAAHRRPARALRPAAGRRQPRQRRPRGRRARALVAHHDVDLVSFTGSAATGRVSTRSRRAPAKTCLELGARTRSSSATTRTSRTPFAGARVRVLECGQRCASASRIVVQGEVYEDFRERLVTLRRRSIRNR